jgi:hypothetical protein
MADAAPILDARTVRRAIASAQDDVCGALRRVAALVGNHDATRLRGHERQEARTLDDLGRAASQLRAVERSSSDEQLLKRAHELKTQADTISARIGALQTFAALKPDAIDVPDRRLSDALNDLLHAIDVTDHELASTPPDEHDPYDWLWDTRLLSYALVGFERLFGQLAARVARSRVAMRAADAYQASSRTRAETAALRAHHAAVARRLHAAGAAARLAARRANLVELHELIHNKPRVEVHINKTPIQITLRERQPANQYALRANHSAFPDHFTFFSDCELVDAIAAVAGLNRRDLAQRRHAHESALRAREQLSAIVAYRDSSRRGDPQDAVSSPDRAAPQIPDTLRPDSRRDLADLLLDLVDEQWPITTTLQDSLTLVCAVLGDGNYGHGTSKLLGHPDDKTTVAALVRRLILA